MCACVRVSYCYSLLSSQWNGKTCNKDEKFKAVQYLQTLKVSLSPTEGVLGIHVASFLV